MKVIYDNKQEEYRIELEGYENITVVNTDDIVEARNLFVKHMESLFNFAICEQLKD